MPTTIDTVLVLSDEPVVAALVGMLVELTGSRPVFANPDEQPTEAVQRLRPLAVILVDAQLDAARSDLFFALAARHDISVAVFGSDDRIRAVAEVAAARRIPWFTLPPDARRLAGVLRAGRRGDTERSGTERRQAPTTTFSRDGTCILRDASGREWMVYDRRVGVDRRDAGADADRDRVFVAEDGETRRYVLPSSESDERTVERLERQLAAAEP